MLLTNTKAFDAYARQRGWFYENHGRYLGEIWEWYAGSNTVARLVLMRQPPDRVALVRYDGLAPTELWSGRVATEVDFDRALTTAGLSDMPNHTAARIRRRQCPFCPGSLRHLSGYERSGPDYAGASREVDDFKCQSCQRSFRHIVKDNFSSFYEWWGLKTDNGWSDLFEGKER